jgi:hypothetical protein
VRSAARFNWLIEARATRGAGAVPLDTQPLQGPPAAVTTRLCMRDSRPLRPCSLREASATAARVVALRSPADESCAASAGGARDFARARRLAAAMRPRSKSRSYGTPRASRRMLCAVRSACHTPARWKRAIMSSDLAPHRLVDGTAGEPRSTAGRRQCRSVMRSAGVTHVAAVVVRRNGTRDGQPCRTVASSVSSR